MIPLITLEEHYLSEAFRAAGSLKGLMLDNFPSDTERKLYSLGDERLKDMQSAGISLQVISYNAAIGAPSLEICQKSNDQLYKAVEKNKASFAGFAVLPMGDPSAAVDELTRCINDLGFVGALVCNHIDGRFYDGPSYHPLFSRLEQLDVPMYIHPTAPSKDMMPLYEGNFPEALADVLSTYGWGWHSDTGLHFTRLFASGLFDTYPKIKLIFGHMGEMLPFMIDRIEMMMAKCPPKKRSVRTVWEENVWITTSGMFTLTPFASVMRAVTMDRILLSVDYPFSQNEEGRDFIDKLSKSGLVTDDELAMIAYRNAETLLRVRAHH